MEIHVSTSLFSDNKDGLRPLNLSDRHDSLLDSIYSQLESLTGEKLYLSSRNKILCDNFFEFPINFLKKSKMLKNFTLKNIRFNDCPRFYQARFVSEYLKESTDGKAVQRTIGSSFGKSDRNVLESALGEYIERYFLTLFHKKNFVNDSYNSLVKKGKAVLDIDFFDRFGEEQKIKFPDRVFDGDSPFYWEKAKRVKNEKSIFVPAQLVYWNYLRDENEPFLGEANTNGCGGHRAKEAAILAGLRELVERDSFMVYWLNGAAPTKIDPSTIPDKNFQELYDEAVRYGFEIFCLDLANDFDIPAVCVIVSDITGAGPRFSVGAACDLNAPKAYTKAYEEAMSIYHASRQHEFYPALDLKIYKPFFDDNIKRRERLSLWANPAMEEHFKFFISGKTEDYTSVKHYKTRIFENPKKELDFFVDNIEKMGEGYEVYYFEAQHHVLKKLKYYSTRVIVPRIVPLYLYETNIPLNCLRIGEAAKKLNLKTSDRINIFPHPFP